MTNKRTYLQTHPWITFDLGAERFSQKTWMLLGEATSKAKHVAGVPLAPKRAQQFYTVYLAKGALATAAIEGNTLSEDQVEQQIEGKLSLPPSQKYLQQEVQNIIDASNDMVRRLDGGHGNRDITLALCCDLNRKVLNNLELPDDVIPGEIRQHNVVVGNVYKGAPPEDCAFLLEQMCEVLNEPTPEGDDPMPIAILKALFAHIYMALIHPFGDGNGRTARLLELLILLQAGFPMPTCHLLSNHYNLTRTKYYAELDKISKTGGNTSSFVHYALQGFVDGLRGQIDVIREEQLRVAWINYVHEQFSGRKSQTDNRRRELVLQLSETNKPVPIADIMELTPRLAREYAGKTYKTLSRDLNALSEMDLITRLPRRRIRANRRLIEAFLPWSAERNGDAEAII